MASSVNNNVVKSRVCPGQMAVKWLLLLSVNNASSTMVNDSRKYHDDNFPCFRIIQYSVFCKTEPSHLRTSSRELEATTAVAKHNLDEEHS